MNGDALLFKHLGIRLRQRLVQILGNIPKLSGSAMLKELDIKYLISMLITSSK